MRSIHRFGACWAEGYAAYAIERQGWIKRRYSRGERNMAQDILALIKADHEKTSSDLKQIMNRAGTAGKGMRNEDFDRMHLELLAHMHAEEEIFYPPLESQMKEEIGHAEEEHETIRRDLTELGRSWSEQAEFTQKLKKMEEDIQHHVEEEEGKIFDGARRIVGMDRLQQMGSQFEEEKRKTSQKGLAGAQRAETAG
jgi:hemerythrin superfamily protein